MDRTVPSRENDEIALYIRTYYSLLRTSANVRIKTLIEAHMSANSALHVSASQPESDMAAFIYAILRLPACLIDPVKHVIMGQSSELFVRYGYPDVQSWQKVGQPARRRPGFYDGQETLAVFVTSRSDIDDLIPILTAYQIERDKLYWQFRKEEILGLLEANQGAMLDDAHLARLAELTNVPADDLERLRRIWKERMADNLLIIATKRADLTVRLLGGTYIEYLRGTRRWWQHIIRETKSEISFECPVYFVSSNSHSLANLLSGYALQEEQQLIDYITDCGDPLLQKEYEDISQNLVPSNRENFLYYALKKYESAYPKSQLDRETHELNAGITRILSQAAYDIEAQIIPINRINPELIDPRLNIAGIDKLAQSDALIFNIDFPLGMAAYHVFSEIGRNVDRILGMYIMGKAATLNGRIGDVMIPKVVHDEQSENTFLFNNCFTAADVAPYLVYGTVLDSQKAMTARGTFLQNAEYMDVFYREGYTIVEMEAGPYLSGAYELMRPQRYMHNQLTNLYEADFAIGMLHYASDTPLSKGKNLGAQNLSYFGMDPTYATMVAILRDILSLEMRRLSGDNIFRR